MGRRMKWIFVVAAVLVLAFPLGVMAQEDAGPTDTLEAGMAGEEDLMDIQDDAALEDDLEEDVAITFGTVTRVDEGEIAILEYDFDADQDVEMAYIIDEDTEFENIASAAALQVDDPVEIVFLMLDGENIALIVKKEELALEEDVLDGDDSLEEEDLGMPEAAPAAEAEE